MSKPDNLTVQLPPLRVKKQTEADLYRDLEEEQERTGFPRKLAGHVRWIIEKHLADKKAKR